jgi:hypothetical protein
MGDNDSLSAFNFCEEFQEPLPRFGCREKDIHMYELLYSNVPTWSNFMNRHLELRPIAAPGLGRAG